MGQKLSAKKNVYSINTIDTYFKRRGRSKLLCFYYIILRDIKSIHIRDF